MYDQLHGWRKHHPILVATVPFLALVHLVYPRGSVARILRSLLIKFVNHNASITIFLILLLIASTNSPVSQGPRVASNDTRIGS
ncbi:unnamed protein product [Taenia asiatica]|uniref:Transmembrane protein n=1 Tax=Taenia asiatica TaxID=60517 RepID=A0A0R3WCV8_TAEAS|nr:unnamed protein product [Taenia asiatica]